MTAILMTFEASTSLITRSKWLHLLETVSDNPSLLPLVLKLVFNAAQIMKGTISTIKEASTSVCLDNNNDLLFSSPCYISSNKRKTPGDDWLIPHFYLCHWESLQKNQLCPIKFCKKIFANFFFCNCLILGTNVKKSIGLIG
jgi:hypothetical protein